MPLNVMLVFLVAFVDILLALIIYFQDPKNIVNKAYSLFAFSVFLWGMGVALFLYSDVPYWSNISARVLYFGGGFIPATFLYFSLVFNAQQKLSRSNLFYLFLPSIFFAYLYFFTDLIISNSFVLSDQETKGFTYGPLKLLFDIHLWVYFTVALLVLAKKFRNSPVAEIKKHTLYIIIGTYSVLFIAAITNLFAPIMGRFELIAIGPIATIIWVGVVTYAVVKKQLFNIKVIATELFIYVLCIISFIRELISTSLQDRIINGGLFLATVILGILLIRGVKEEIGGREKIRHLVQRLSETNFNLAKTNEQLRIIDQRKSEFISIVSHQLRTPITAIKGYASLILEDSYGKLPDSMKVPIERIFHSSDRLVGMVAEFLDISKIEQGTMTYNLTPVDVGALLDDLSDDFKQAIEDKNLEFHVHILNGNKFMAIADEGKMRQIFSNMIDNSIKYTIQGEVNIFLERDDVRNIIAVKVKDTGIGLSQDDIHHLFGKFTRGTGGQGQNTEGSGLGLYIAKKMLEAQNGDIWVDSEGVGKGSTFIIELPAEKK